VSYYGSLFTVTFLHDNGLQVDDVNVGAFFQPDITSIDQILKTLVAVFLLLRNEIFDSCECKSIP